MNRSFGAACALTLLSLSLPAIAEDRMSPSPTTTARMSGNKLRAGKTRGRKLRASDVPTRTHGSRVNVRTADEGRKPAAAKIPIRRAK